MKHDRLIKLMLFCIIGYAIYNHHKTDFKKVESETTQKVAEIKQLFDLKEDNSAPIATVKTGSNPSDFEKKFAEIANRLLNTPQAKNTVNVIAKNLSDHKEMSDTIKRKGYHAKDVEQGSGQSAKCGQNVSIEYTAPSSITDQNNFEKSPITITLGNGNLPKEVEAGIIGMKSGGTRKISFYAGPDKKPMNSTVSLDKINDHPINTTLSCLAK